MRSDWRNARLAELGRIVTGKTPPSAVEGCFGGSTPFVTPSDYDGSKYIRRTARTLTARGEQAIGGARLPIGAVMVTCIGSDMGKVALNAAEAFTNQQINSLIVESGDLPEYVYYNLLMRKTELRTKASGSAQPILNKSAFGATQIELPSPPAQAAIVEVLGRLDDRIDVLRRTNATLESIAQALFKSWFIDFDPVRAKADGREPEGMDAATAALFPAEFDMSPGRSIPLGWTIDNIYKIAEVRYGAPFASKRFNTEGEGIPLVRIRDLKNEAPGVWTQEQHPKGTKIHPGDIVVGMDGEFRAYLWGGEGAWMNQRICMFVPKPPHSSAFVRLSIAAPLAHVEATETATTVIHLGKADIDRFRVVIPSTAIAQVFKDQCQPLYGRIVANKQAVRTLSELRDTLLPRLISGRLRLPDAEADIEAVA